MKSRVHRSVGVPPAEVPAASPPRGSGGGDAAGNNLRRGRRSYGHAVLFSLLALAACHRAPAPTSAASTTVFEVRGVVKKVSAERRKAVIAHEAIPNYMDAMTMEFDVPDAADFAAMQPGGALAFRLSVTDTRSWIDHVRQIADAPGSLILAASAADAAPAGQLPPGAPAPDCALVDQRGAALHLADFKGRALAVTFIFTRCPLPDFCPRLSHQFEAVQRALAQPGADANWQLLSISFDPDYDTPARLAEYAAHFHPDAAHWIFATGARDEVRKFGGAFGLSVAGENAQLNHNLRTVVVDAAGRVQKIFAGNEWTAAELTAEMQRAMIAKP